MSYPSQQRVPYGMAGVPVPAVGGVPGMAGVAGITGVPAGMTAMPAMGGVARVPNGMSSVGGVSSIYADKSAAGLYPSGTATYQGLVQPTYLQQANAATGQPSYYAAAQQSGYLSATSPTSAQRYMVSPHAYSVAGTLSPQGYALSAGGSYATLSAQPSTLTQTMPVATSTLTSQTQTQYPTYLGSQLGTVQISPSQSPYAAAATGHPLYPGSPYAGLQMQPTQVQTAQMPGQIGGRMGSAYNTATGLPLGYPAPSSMDAVRASFYPPY